MTSAAEARQGLVDLTTLARRDLAAFWALVQDWPVEQVRDALMDVLPALGDQYGDAAAELAASYFETERERADARGSFTPVLPERTASARWEALARWGVDPLFAPTPDAATALSLVTGGLTRSIADQHRQTIVYSSAADPQAQGWRRVARADGCSFCQMLASRPGYVYGEKSVEFRSHDNCRCSAAPSWDPKVEKILTGIPYRQSQRKAGWSPERRARENRQIRDYLADR